MKKTLIQFDIIEILYTVLVVRQINSIYNKNTFFINLIYFTMSILYNHIAFLI